MKLATLLVGIVLSTLSVFAQEEEAGHMHGPDGRHIVATSDGNGDTSSFILSHHDMRVEGSNGKSVLNVKVNSTIYPKGEPNNPIHTEKNVYEPENEVYGSHMTYREAGEYVISQAVEMPDGKKMNVEFPVYVPALSASTTAPGHDEHHHVNWFAWIGGALAALAILWGAFKLGQKNGKGVGMSVLIVLLITGSFAPIHVVAQEEEEGHMHGADGRHIVTSNDAKAAAGPQLKAYPTPDRGESASRTQDGYKFVLSIENESMTPDPDLITVPKSNSELIGLKTAAVEVSSTAGGLQTTGRVSANPNGMVKVNARASGRVIRLGALPGTEVQKGQMLAVIESPELAEAQSSYRTSIAGIKQAEAGVKITEAGLVSARTELRISEQNLARQKQFAQTGVFDSPSLETAKSNLSEAKSTVESNTAEIKTLESLLSRQREGLRSGVVAAKDVEQTEGLLTQARGELSDAKNQLTLAQSAVTREESIANRSLRSTKEIEQAKASADQARAALKSAQSRVAQANADLTRARSGVRIASDQISILGGSVGGGNTITLTSPISAEVEHRFVSVGQTVSTGTELYDLLNADIVWVLVDVYEKDLKRIRVGQNIEVVADAHPEKTYEGQVTFIHNEVDPETRTTPVRVVINNPGERLKQNMFVRVILATRQESLTLVPSSSMQKEGGIDVVFTEEKRGTYRKNIVQAQGTIGNRTIVKGLKSGQLVVTDGSYQLLSMVGGK
jgi:multidrug efflux pump subunit AcrA (membrane-fusion protein)